MVYLILSDIHANWEALDAVLRHASGRYGEIVCLGDVVGYGADPNAVTDWVRANVPRVIRGNHDKACCGLEDPLLFNPVARYAAEWTRDTLSPENREYLWNLAAGPMDQGDFLMVHGSILDEDQYLIDSQDAIPQLGAAGGRLAFFGHTHVQGGFLLSDLDQERPADHSGTGTTIRIVPGESQLLNPGSVGQPRDLQWEAAYALYDTSRQLVEFARCPYDLTTAQQKIREAGLPPALADRLAEGR
jgi:diadenosine tetraphosphatase ApaH/serine/threonine PP2A family protein phosphatase